MSEFLNNTTPPVTWDYQKRSAEVDALRQQNLQNLRLSHPLATPVKPILQDPRATATQLELFDLVGRDSYDYVEQLLRRLPSLRQREHFRKLYVRAYHDVQDDGSIAFKFGQRQQFHANTFLRELLEERLGKVFAQYQFDFAWLSMTMADKWQWALSHLHECRDVLHTSVGVCNTPLQHPRIAYDDDISVAHEKSDDVRRKLPFYLMSEAKLAVVAHHLSFIFSKIQTDFFTEQASLMCRPPLAGEGAEGGRGQENEGTFTEADIDGLVVALYRQLGLLCEKIGLECHYWKTFAERDGNSDFRPNIKSIEIALNKTVCDKHWLRALKKAQKQMVEHLAIACGDVRKGVAAYISDHGFSEWRSQMKKNFNFLKEMIVENVDDPDEQIELLTMFQKSSANPSIRRLEMMTRLRGIEEWADEYEREALFLTLTAPSSFHAQHSQGGQNKKWSGASPRQTHAYLNKVWQQFRALLAKRGIAFFGMRVAEPHHDGTPHWHLLLYVERDYVDEVSELFRKKALELDGDERGASQHRCKIEKCDKAKGSATAYIAKYISKNIDGFSEFGEVSDEVEGLSMKDNARRARAWASLWGIRQFQFYGASSIGVWRELRRLTAGQCDDEQLELLRIGADLGEFAFYLDKQGGGGASRSAQIAKLHYEDREENKYGEVGKKIVGIANVFKQAGEWVKTRLKNWVIKKGSVKSATEQGATDTNTERSSAWTCVSNCNPSNSKGSGAGTGEIVENFINAHGRQLQRLKMALGWRGIDEKMFTETQFFILLNGGSVQLLGKNYISFDGNEVLICSKG
ncbi:MAG: replication endonuclease [Pasteurellaceae bacterium]|nr:replication endonuclease [Pasteurellaceae bacterium]